MPSNIVDNEEKVDREEKADHEKNLSKEEPFRDAQTSSDNTFTEDMSQFEEAWRGKSEVPDSITISQDVMIGKDDSGSFVEEDENKSNSGSIGISVEGKADGKHIQPSFIDAVEKHLVDIPNDPAKETSSQNSLRHRKTQGISSVISIP